MRHEVLLQAQSTAKDTGGTNEDILTYATYDTVWASIRPMQGGEMESARQISEVVTHKIRIRYQSAIKPLDRIIFDSRTFEVKNILNYEERNVYLDLLCIEVV